MESKMKNKISIVALVMVAALLVGGCAENSFLCKNKEIIMEGLQFALSQATVVITSIQAEYPDVIPLWALGVLAAAQMAKNAAEAALAKACPTEANLQEVQMLTKDAMFKAQSMGLKLRR